MYEALPMTNFSCTCSLVDKKNQKWGCTCPSWSKSIPDDVMGVHLKVKQEVDKKKEETLAAGKEYLPITNDMIVSSCIQVKRKSCN